MQAQYEEEEEELDSTDSMVACFVMLERTRANDWFREIHRGSTVCFGLLQCQILIFFLVDSSHVCNWH